jgi:hypothetical protein
VVCFFIFYKNVPRIICMHSFVSQENDSNSNTHTQLYALICITRKWLEQQCSNTHTHYTRSNTEHSNTNRYSRAIPRSLPTSRSSCWFWSDTMSSPHPWFWWYFCTW